MPSGPVCRPSTSLPPETRARLRQSTRPTNLRDRPRRSTRPTLRPRLARVRLASSGESWSWEQNQGNVIKITGSIPPTLAHGGNVLASDAIGLTSGPTMTAAENSEC